MCKENIRYEFFIIFFLLKLFLDSVGGEVPKKIDIKQEILPPCQACKVLVKSFLNGMSDTNKKHFGGGDTAWEEEKLGDYASSEVRLIEIQENLCTDVIKGQQQCYQLAEEWEQLMEEWWFGVQPNGTALEEWLCVQKAKFCCPDNHFGPECLPCKGYPHSICSNNGKCKGSGTRRGSGECLCHKGYSGSSCEECASGYVMAQKDGDRIVCIKCHESCKTCNSPGPQGCVECNTGWEMGSNQRCLDINECQISDPCPQNEFCVNNEGSFECLERDFESSIKWPRYLTYSGLIIVTLLIFRKNAILAGFIALTVAVYISLSEYPFYFMFLHSLTTQ